MTIMLNNIANDVRECTACKLHSTRTFSVPGEGPSNAHIMLIGEGPGKNEDLQGRPFVGNAGKLLTDLLAQANLTREDVFICNVVKCRPPNNRDPESDEIRACNVYLDAQIDVIKPRIIITLGRFSMAKFFPGVKISQVHGKMKQVGDHFVIPMFHPAAALHQPNLKATIIEDFANLPKLLRIVDRQFGREFEPAGNQGNKNDPPHQLKML